MSEMRRLRVETVVVKPPSLFASQGVSFLPGADGAAVRAAFADLVGQFGYVIAEPYLGPGDNRPPADLRVLATCRRVVGVIERIIPPGGGLHDVRRGGPLNVTQARVVDGVLAFLKGRGIFLAGLDFIGDTLTEINVSCPGAIPEVNLFCDVTAEDLILDDLRLEYGQDGRWPA